MTANLPLPDLDDVLTKPFWEAAREGRLVMPVCTTCGYLQWPPERVCPQCQNRGLDWQEVPAVGTLWSYAVYHRALDPAFADKVPYVVGLIEIDGADRKMYGLMNNTEDEVEIGARVYGVFTPVTEDVTFVNWEMDDSAAPTAPEA